MTSRCKSPLKWFYIMALYQLVIVCFLTFVVMSWTRHQDVTRFVVQMPVPARDDSAPLHKRHAADLNVTILLENKTICHGLDTVSVLFMVHTAPSHTAHRQAIRATYANSSHHPTHSVRVIFLLGVQRRPNKLNIQTAIDIEHRLFGDIIQGNFIDAYTNLTYKGVMGFKWITQHCKNVDYVIKIDDDVYVDTFNFFANFYTQRQKNMIMCHSWPAWSLLVERRSRWRVSKHHMRRYDAYPWDSCSGYAVVISGSLVPRLYKAALMAPFLWIDDIYLFGLLPDLVGNVTRLHLEDKRYSNRSRREVIQCFNTSECQLVISSAQVPDIHELWRARHRTYLSGHMVPVRTHVFVNGSIYIWDFKTKRMEIFMNDPREYNIPEIRTLLKH
ncbi:UDP-GalNAc:beta-1,3-N-acetylgalactosaminyltransferase 1-like [Haliotis cracherodii]|uniref:UDP-GalNAc:beta-1, 3-N-acetylgalactosaminyltransferase 1-like n=1 Tax=Haliotis cracherodii TaxID=6455 RepID=UPI0039E7D656